MDQTWTENLKKMETKLAELKMLPKKDPGVYLHVGCGPQILNGFINIDLYAKDLRVVNLDMRRLEPFTDVKAVYSSHSLEHLPYRIAKLTLRNWAKALIKNGKLFLAIPDLEEIMRLLLDPTITGAKRDWYMYCLFGFQVDPSKYSQSQELALPEDKGQYHVCGFTKATIQGELELSGFKVDEMFNYDGYGTPSIWVEASLVRPPLSLFQRLDASQNSPAH